jgi:1-acyl-sn-glycerol-3-phosphate acyltransferase
MPWTWIAPVKRWQFDEKDTIGMIAVSQGVVGEKEGAADAVPQVSPFLAHWFGRYATRHLANHFHAVRMSKDSSHSNLGETGPLVVYGNHASWWDPMIAVFLTRQVFAGKKAFAPIDAAALEQYRFFEKLGFFGVDQKEGRRGAAQFLKTTGAILGRQESVLWLTPQGEFADVRSRPVVFQAGIAHLARRSHGVTFLPLAIEYVFWEERFPETLLQFGDPVSSEQIAAVAPDTESALQLLSRSLEGTQDGLAKKSRDRDPAEFDTLLKGKSGASAVYDFWRSFSARLRGRKFDPHHGSK